VQNLLTPGRLAAYIDTVGSSDLVKGTVMDGFAQLLLRVGAASPRPQGPGEMSGGPDGLSAFLAELKRRRVYQVAGVYAAAAFVAAQAAELFLPRLGLPDWTVTLVVVLAVAGFPVALILGWAFDITPAGVTRTESASDAQPAALPAKWRIAGGTATAVLVLAGGGWWLSGIAFAPSPSIQSLAILPLENLSGDPEQDYFVAGMHDGLISELGRIGALRVISRQTMMRYRNSDKTVPEIARELNVAGVIEASVLRSNGEVQLGVRLIRALPEEQNLWAETYTRELPDVRTMHAEVARALAHHIGVPLRPVEAERLDRSRRVNPETYEAYLRGMFHVNRGTREDLRLGMAYFREAVEKDPGDPLAYAGMALGYITIAHGPEPPAEALSLARAAAERAVRLDETLAEAHAALGFIKGYYDWEWEAAQRAIDHALDMDPNLAIAHYHQSWFDVLFDRMDEAIAAHKRAQELDPLVPMHTAWLGEIYRMVGRYDEAIAEAERAIDFAPASPLGYVALGRVYTDQGRHAEAIAAHTRAGELAPTWRWAVVRGYVKAGRTDDARRLLAELEAEPVTPWNASWRAVAHANLGNLDEAFRWLNYERPHAWLPWIRVLDWFGPLQDDPRFLTLLRRMNLPP
jgi:pentatricopeptide repeat protein